MKLISLYIENFGGLHHYSLNFEEGLTSVTEPNGFGKTTLAEFIRTMFYGFPRKSKTLDKSRRQKYTPWNGGRFGGNLIFDYENRRYRMERTFGTNPKGDTFTVIDLETNRKTNRFTEEIGQELFGLDADSFERSTYLPQLRENSNFATASIQAKLSDLVEDSSDVANFDKAMAALRSKRSALVPYRGSGGTIAETTAEITTLQLRLDALRAKEMKLAEVREEAASLQQETERIKKRLEQLCGQLQTAAQQETDILRQQQYFQLQTRHSRAAERLRFYEKKYACGLPEEAALRRMEVLAERLTGETASVGRKEPAPSAEQLEHGRGLYREYTALQIRLRELRLRAAELEQEKALYAAPKSGSLKVPVMVGLLGMVGAAAGTVLLLALQWSYWFVLAAVGILMMVSTIAALCLRGSKQRRQRQTVGEKLTELQRQSGAVNGMIEKYRRDMTVFFAGFGMTVAPHQCADALNELEYRITREVQQTKEMAADREELRTFLDAMGLPLTQDIHTTLAQLREDLRAAQAAQILTQELADQLAAMKETCGDILFAEFSATENPQFLRSEELRLRTELTAVTTRMLQARQKAQQLREEIMLIPEIQETLEQLQQRLVEDRENVLLLDATMEFLQQARENLATTYMGTICSRFGHYLSLLGSDEARYLIDSDLQIQLEQQGISRELAYFSAGQTDLVVLCMRLALVDALFQGQEMFLILDDPFVNLDDEHTEQARVLLRKLSAQRQILYLCCHSSRAI